MAASEYLIFHVLLVQLQPPYSYQEKWAYLGCFHYLSEGVHSVKGDNGVNVSGGTRIFSGILRERTRIFFPYAEGGNRKKMTASHHL